MNYPRLFAFLLVATLFAAATPLSSKSGEDLPARALSALAQQNASVPAAPITVWLTVHALKDSRAATLTSADISVFEDGQVQSILSLSREETQPLVVGLLMQVSGERHDTLPHAEIEPAILFFRALLTNHNVGFAVNFSEKAVVARDFTSEPAEMERALRKAAGSELVGCSGLFDAVAAVSAKFASAGPQRRAIVVVADGHDNCSRRGVSAAIEAALRAGVKIYFVNLAYADPAYKRGTALAHTFRSVVNTSKQMAESTGGNITFVRNREDLPPAFDAIAADLRGQYKLTYNSSNSARDARFRNLTITSARQDIQILAPQGYYPSGH